MRHKSLFQLVLGVVMMVGLTMGSAWAWGDDTAQLKDQIKALQDRVDQLESQLANKQQQVLQPPASPAMMPPMMTPGYDQWNDPFAQMLLMREQMAHNMPQAIVQTEVFNPSMDMKQTDKEYLITMDIPGMDKNKINIETKGDMLVISGERQSDIKDNSNQYYRQERSFGSFMQAIPLPEDAKADQIDAKYNNGVLTLTLGCHFEGVTYGLRGFLLCLIIGIALVASSYWLIGIGLAAIDPVLSQAFSLERSDCR